MTSRNIFLQKKRAGLALNYVLKNVGDSALSGLPMFSAASLVRTRLSMLKSTFYEIRYKYFKAPWESGPREELVALIKRKRITPCRAIDLGCGTGSNAIFLAEHGFDVTGVDFSSTAIEQARTKAKTVGVAVTFIVDDFTILQHVIGPFDFLLDYGAFDHLSPKDRKKYIQNVLPLTHQGSQFLLWCFEWKLRWWERFFLWLFPFASIAL